MIKRLRKKFIIVTMCSVLAVLVLIVGIINIVSYVNIGHNADNVISVLKENGGRFDKDGNGKPPDGEFGGMHGGPMSPETPFRTRYFTVVLDASGTVQFVDTDKIVSVDQTQAAEYAVKLYRKNKDSGFYGDYRYGTTVAEDGGTMYIFMDCTEELSNFKEFLLVSIVVGVSAFAAVFILVFFLSGRVMKPVAESYAKQKKFITDAGHEIKTPLTIIGAATEVLELHGTENEWTESIKTQVKRFASLTDKLVFLARMDEENRTIRATDFSLSDAVEETVKPFYAVAVSKGLTLDCDIQGDVTYCGDESMMRQLVSLLLDNALKYSDEDGRVCIELKTIGNKVHFSVSNPAKDLDGDLSVLFERFYRNDQSRNSQTGGHGIGLSVVKAIVDAHKAKITARGENGKVTFSVIL